MTVRSGSDAFRAPSHQPIAASDGTDRTIGNHHAIVEIHHIIHWEDNLLSLCPRHHRMHHTGELGITGNADQPDGITFTDHHGNPIPDSHPPDPPPEGIPLCDRPYEPPPAGKMNYDWVGLGWAHPNALQHRRDQANQWRTN